MQLFALIVENSMQVKPKLNCGLVERQQTRHQDLTILRANEHFHHCSGGHFKIFPLYKGNTVGDFLRRRKETLLINILKPTLNDK